MKVEKLIRATFEGRKDHGILVRVTPGEALAIIQSLAEQMRTGNPNSGRML